jgi:hypothetical protein
MTDLAGEWALCRFASQRLAEDRQSLPRNNPLGDANALPRRP